MRIKINVVEHPDLIGGVWLYIMLEILDLEAFDTQQRALLGCKQQMRRFSCFVLHIHSLFMFVKTTVGAARNVVTSTADLQFRESGFQPLLQDSCAECFFLLFFQILRGNKEMKNKENWPVMHLGCSRNFRLPPCTWRICKEKGSNYSLMRWWARMLFHCVVSNKNIFTKAKCKLTFPLRAYN